MAHIPRTDKLSIKSHVHALVREPFEYKEEKYRYRCLSCGVRFKLRTGVLVDDLAAYIAKQEKPNA